MNGFDPTGTHAVLRGVDLRDQVYAPPGVTCKSHDSGG